MERVGSGLVLDRVVRIGEGHERCDDEFIAVKGDGDPVDVLDRFVRGRRGADHDLCGAGGDRGGGSLPIRARCFPLVGMEQSYSCLSEIGEGGVRPSMCLGSLPGLVPIMLEYARAILARVEGSMRCGGRSYEIGKARKERCVGG